MSFFKVDFKCSNKFFCVSVVVQQISNFATEKYKVIKLVFQGTFKYIKVFLYTGQFFIFDLFKTLFFAIGLIVTAIKLN